MRRIDDAFGTWRGVRVYWLLENWNNRILVAAGRCMLLDVRLGGVAFWEEASVPDCATSGVGYPDYYLLT